MFLLIYLTDDPENNFSKIVGRDFFYNRSVRILTGSSFVTSIRRKLTGRTKHFKTKALLEIVLLK